MKKTRILLVLAIAMLAMFAMSACTLIASGIEKVEFEVMPKNYFSTTEIAEGFDVSFTATIAGKEYPVKVEIEANKTEYDLTVGGLPVKVKTNKALATTMGEHEIVVTAEGVMATYAYRVCTVTTDLSELEDTGAIGYYMLADEVVLKDQIDVARSFVLYGEGKAIVAASGYTATNATAFYIAGENLNGGTFEFNNVVINMPKVTTCVRSADLNGATFNFNAANLSCSHYAIDFRVNTVDLVVNVSNGTTAKAWNAITTRSNNSIFNIDNVEFYGENNLDATYGYGTIVVDGDGYRGPLDRNEAVVAGMYGCNNTFNISNTQISAVTKKGPTQYVVSVQYLAAKNVINLTNCTDVDGNVITAPAEDLFSMMDDWGYKPLNVDCYLTDKAMWNVMYINATRFDASDMLYNATDEAELARH